MIDICYIKNNIIFYNEYKKDVDFNYKNDGLWLDVKNIIIKSKLELNWYNFQKQACILNTLYNNLYIWKL
jgi:hypothetical protein